MTTRLIPQSLVVPDAKKGVGFPAYCATYLADGSIAFVAGRSATWQRIAVLSPELAVLREAELAGSSEASQPEQCVSIDDSIVVFRRWGENLAFDPIAMASVLLPRVFAKAETGVALPGAGYLAATRAGGRGEQTELLAAASRSDAPSRWSVALLEAAAAAWGTSVLPGECGRMIRAGNELLISTYTTMKGGEVASPTLSRVMWGTGQILAHACDPGGLGRDGDIRWDASSHTFVVVNPNRQSIERWSAALQLLAESPSYGYRLLAMAASGEAIWMDAGARALVRTEPAELPIAGKRKPRIAVDWVRSTFPAIELLDPEPKALLRRGDRLVVGEGVPSSLTKSTSMRFERAEEKWRAVSDKPMWVNGVAAQSCLLRHGDVIHAGVSVRYLERDWIVARDMETEADLADHPDDAERYRAYAEWLVQRSDPLGHRMLSTARDPADDTRWLGPYLGSVLPAKPPQLAIEWFFGLVRAATLYQDFPLGALVGCEAARFLRHLTIHTAPFNVGTVLRVLVARDLPAVSRRTGHKARSLETIAIHSPGRLAHSHTQALEAQNRALFEQIKQRWPALRTSFDELFVD